MSYALTTLWHERQRFLPGILAVAFSALLIALQCGLLMGLFSITSLPIDHTNADIWMGAPRVVSVDLGRPIRAEYLARLASQPEVIHAEPYLQGFAYWAKPNGGTELCMVVGSRLEAGALGAVNELTPEFRARLTEPGAIIVDESDLGRLGIKGVGDYGEVSGHRVRVVGLTRGVKSLAGPYVFCSLETATPLLRLLPDQITYVLAKCRSRADAERVVARLRQRYKEPGPEGKIRDTMSVFTSNDFSVHSQVHWLTKTKAGIALGYAAALGLLVGAVVTSQTLYAATVASLREFAVLRALGIPRWRMGLMVLAQSFWVGLIGIALAMPAVYGLAALADTLGVQVLLKWWLLIGAVVVTLVMAMMSGVLALRSLRLVEPAILLR
jgi:putative ABC transport system permease protein